MLIKERPKKPGMKELKVNIPVKYHLQLHSLKVMEGRQIHGVVQEALDKYFASLRAAQEDARDDDGTEDSGMSK
ncbi:MAG TPA: hypothetical protein VM370_06720 [Candidatus Thermoplasmatota archaeon]|nr:hypothetical protein [Candidatus Thermoplasmatota archaeon]